MQMASTCIKNLIFISRTIKMPTCAVHHLYCCTTHTRVYIEQHAVQFTDTSPYPSKPASISIWLTSLILMHDTFNKNAIFLQHFLCFFFFSISLNFHRIAAQFLNQNSDEIHYMRYDDRNAPRTPFSLYVRP